MVAVPWTFDSFATENKKELGESVCPLFIIRPFGLNHRQSLPARPPSVSGTVRARLMAQQTVRRYNRLKCSDTKLLKPLS
jgi:hypothetical protein